MRCVDFVENALFKSLATFSDHHGLLCYLSSSRSMKETVAASFQKDQCVAQAIVLVTRLTHH